MSRADVGRPLQDLDLSFVPGVLLFDIEGPISWTALRDPRGGVTGAVVLVEERLAA